MNTQQNTFTPTGRKEFYQGEQGKFLLSPNQTKGDLKKGQTEVFIVSPLFTQKKVKRKRVCVYRKKLTGKSGYMTFIDANALHDFFTEMKEAIIS